MTDGTQGSGEGSVPRRVDPREPVGGQPGPEDTVVLRAVIPGFGPAAGPGYPQPHPGPQPQPGPVPVQTGYGYPQAPFRSTPHAATPPPFAASSSTPDWEALADAGESTQRRRRRWRIAAIAVAVCLVGAGVGLVVAKGPGSRTTTARSHSVPTGSVPSPVPSSAPPVPSAQSSAPPSFPLRPGDIADYSGQIPLAPSSDAVLKKVSGGDALALRGAAGSYAQAAGPVVDVTQDFTVSAWIYNDDAPGAWSALSQGDGSSFSFNLGQAKGASGSWEFQIQSSGQGAGRTVYQVSSAKAGTVDQWVLLTGTYDSATRTIALYVNGQPAGSTTVPGIWNSPGPLEVGRVRQRGLWDGYWTGVIGHIQFWNRALTPTQAADLKSGVHGGGSKPVDSWLVD